MDERGWMGPMGNVWDIGWDIFGEWGKKEAVKEEAVILIPEIIPGFSSSRSFFLFSPFAESMDIQIIHPIQPLGAVAS